MDGYFFWAQYFCVVVDILFQGGIERGNMSLLSLSILLSCVYLIILMFVSLYYEDKLDRETSRLWDIIDELQEKENRQASPDRAELIPLALFGLPGNKERSCLNMGYKSRPHWEVKVCILDCKHKGSSVCKECINKSKYKKEELNGE